MKKEGWRWEDYFLWGGGGGRDFNKGKKKKIWGNWGVSVAGEK